MNTKNAALVPGEFYHIYNRGNNRENVFIEEKNYAYFMRLYDKYILPAADTYAYCLLRNHFHFLVRIKDLQGFQNLEGLPGRKTSQPFSNFFNAYTKAFNKAYGRSGALFEGRFKRKHISTNAHFRVLIAYIHQNPQKHGFVDDYRDWPYSSYHALMCTEETRLKRAEVLEWFDGQEGFIHWHQQFPHPEAASVLIPEDFG